MQRGRNGARAVHGRRRAQQSKEYHLGCHHHLPHPFPHRSDTWRRRYLVGFAGRQLVLHHRRSRLPGRRLAALPAPVDRAMALRGDRARHAVLGGLGNRLRLVGTRPARRHHRAGGAVAADAMGEAGPCRARRPGAAHPCRAGVTGGGRLFDDDGPKGHCRRTRHRQGDPQRQSWRRCAGRRMALLRPHAVRPALFAARPDHAGQCRQPAAGLDLPHRRREGARRHWRDHLSGDAAQDRRHALYLHAAQFRHRHRRRDRQGEMALRSQDQARQGPPAPDLPRRFLLCRCRHRRRPALRETASTCRPRTRG